MKNNYPLAKADPKTFYGGNEKGYTDYPVHQWNYFIYLENFIITMCK